MARSRRSSLSYPSTFYPSDEEERPPAHASTSQMHALEAAGAPPQPDPSAKGSSAKLHGLFDSGPGRASSPALQYSPPSSFASHLDDMGDRAEQEAPLEMGGVTIPACERIALDALKLQRRIGAGAMGTMYLARWGDKMVAVKAAGGSDLDAWLREVAALQRLSHPNVVAYLGAVIEPPTHALVLEYMDGHDLTAALELPAPPGFILQVATGVAEGMAYLHKEKASAPRPSACSRPHLAGSRPALLPSSASSRSDLPPISPDLPR